MLLSIENYLITRRKSKARGSKRRGLGAIAFLWPQFKVEGIVGPLVEKVKKKNIFTVSISLEFSVLS